MIARWIRRIQFLLRRGRLEDELVEEIETHRALCQRTLEQAGFETSEAAAASRRIMGNVALAREDAHDLWSVAAIDHIRAMSGTAPARCGASRRSRWPRS